LKDETEIKITFHLPGFEDLKAATEVKKV